MFSMMAKPRAAPAAKKIDEIARGAIYITPVNTKPMAVPKAMPDAVTKASTPRVTPEM